MRPPPPPYPDDLPEAATRTAARAAALWQPRPGRDRPGSRIATTARLTWQTTYPIAYAHAYNTLTHRAGIALQDLHQAMVAAGMSHSHDTHAVQVMAQTAPAMVAGPNAVLPMPSDVLKTAVNAVLNRGDDVTAAHAVTMAVHARAARMAGVAGALTAATDLEAIWHLMAGTEERTTDAIHKQLATLNRDFITDWMNRDHLPSTPSALAKTSFTNNAAAAPSGQMSSVDNSRRRSIFRHGR